MGNRISALDAAELSSAAYFLLKDYLAGELYPDLPPGWQPNTDLSSASADGVNQFHNSNLDAGDTNFAAFKVVVTNADGTTTLRTLAELAIGSIAMVLGGIVSLGSNVSTLRQTESDIGAAEMQRAELIGGIDLQVVEDVPLKLM